MKTIAVVLLVVVAGLVGYVIGHGNGGGSTTVIRGAASPAQQRSGNPFSEALREQDEHNPFSEALKEQGSP